MKLNAHLSVGLTRALGAATLLALSGCQTMLPWSLTGAKEPVKVQAAAEAPVSRAAAAARPAAAEPSAPAPVAAQRAESAGMVAPLIEKRETLTATGYAVISVQNHRNPAQQRLMAIRAATVADMMVQSDTFRAKVEGVIYGAVLVSITPAGDDTYETTLSLDKAVVQDLRALYLGQVQARAR
jgi:hypothetical protein